MSTFVVLLTIVLPAILSLVFLWLLVAPLFGYRPKSIDQHSGCQDSHKTINVQNNTFYINHVHVNKEQDGEDWHDHSRDKLGRK